MKVAYYLLALLLFTTCSEPKEKTRTITITVEDTSKLAFVKDLIGLQKDLSVIYTTDSAMRNELSEKRQLIDSLIDRTLDYKENQIKVLVFKKRYDEIKLLKDKVYRKIDSLKIRNSTLTKEYYILQSDYVTVKTEKQVLSTENKKLKTKVTQGSTLTLTGVKINGVGYTSGIFSKAKEVQTNKIAKVKKLRIFFILPANALAEHGDKEIKVTVYSVNTTASIKKDTTIVYDGLEKACTFVLAPDTKFFSTGGHKVTISINGVTQYNSTIVVEP